MKRSIKCYTAFSILFALVVPFLLTSSNASALKYAYNAFPLYQSIVYDRTTYSSWNPTFEIIFDTTNQNDLSYDDELQDSTLTPIMVDNGVCFDNTQNNQYIFSVQNVGFRNQLSFWSGEGTHFYKTIDDLNRCDYYNIKKYAYDSVYSADYNMTNGDVTKLVDVRNLFFDPENSLYDEASIKKMIIPLNVSNTNVGTIPAETPLQWNFGLAQVSANNFEYFDSNVHYYMDLMYLNSNNTVVTDRIDNLTGCSLDDNYKFQTNTDEERRDWLGFNITCNYTPHTSVKYLSAQLTIYGGNNEYNPSNFLTYDYDGAYFNASYLITNNDTTWSGLTANDAPTGESLEDAPGYHQLYGYSHDSNSCVEGDFLCQLSSIFSFDLLNPFRPLFNLFLDQNSCQQIPILASMIHSQETQVCPWFSAQTRNIVTPVLGIASIMLLFGFIVRWLGARSGNFFEDSTDGHDVGSIHVGRRNKK